MTRLRDMSKRELIAEVKRLRAKLAEWQAAPDTLTVDGIKMHASPAAFKQALGFGVKFVDGPTTVSITPVIDESENDYYK